jgi:hypothetical protein
LEALLNLRTQALHLLETAVVAESIVFGFASHGHIPIWVVVLIMGLLASLTVACYVALPV